MMKAKFYKFTHAGAMDIVVAENDKGAISFYMNDYADIKDVLDASELTIERLSLEEIAKKRLIYSEHTNADENTSYFEIFVENTNLPVPRVIISSEM